MDFGFRIAAPQGGAPALVEMTERLGPQLLDAVWAHCAVASPYHTLQALAIEALQQLPHTTPLVLCGLPRPADASVAAAIHLFNLALIEQLGAFAELRFVSTFYDDDANPAQQALYLQAVAQPGARAMLNLAGLNACNAQAFTPHARPVDVPADRLLRATQPQRWSLDGELVTGRTVFVPPTVTRVLQLQLGAPPADASPVTEAAPAIGALQHAHRLAAEGRIDVASAAAVLRDSLVDANLPLASELALHLAHTELGAGRLEACLQLLDSTLAALESPPLRQLRGDVARHLAGLQLRGTSGQIAITTGHFASTTLRPIRAADHRLVADAPIGARIAIVMQGPVLHEHGFTLETLKLYQRMFPGVALLLSTWADEDVAAIQAAGLPDLHLLLNDKPPLPGPSHINYQATSARNGIRHAIDTLQPEFVLKTRTDMRLNNPNLFADLLALLEAFPLTGDAAGRQQQRLLVLSDVVKYMLHAAPDKNMFGTAADMLAYWSPPPDERTGALPAQLSMRAFAATEPAEVYLLRHYLRRIDRPFEDTLADHFAVLRDHFIVCDRSAADLYWHKYAHHLEYRFRNHGDNSSLEEFGFNDWLRLRSRRHAPAVPEAVLDVPSGAAITGLLPGAA